MGCDIHMVVQMQRFEGASWDPAPIHGFGDRDYRLFAALAGVRNRDGIKPIAPPRGLPPMSPPYESEEDGSLTGDVFLCDRWWDGGYYDSKKAADQGRDHRWLGEHSFSHLTLTEIVEWPGWTEQDVTTVPGWHDFVEALRALADERGLPHDRIRIVFGFDS